MTQFTKIEDLFNQFRDDQSIGGVPTEGDTGNEVVRIFQPDRGLDVLIKNVNYDAREQSSDRTTGVTDSFDERQKLGTITLNNRDYWENLNFNSNNFQPYLTGDRIVFQTAFTQQDGNDETIVNNEKRLQSTTHQFSIDAIPFVINPNTDEIIRLDRYYDKDIDSEKYQLATEGKINYYILPRASGRTDLENIDTYGFKGVKTANGGLNRFDVYANTEGDTGYHLFRLDWGDGSELEHTSETLILESTTLLEHEYEKPGFYTISGVVMSQFENSIGGYEKFETNILINPSEDYDVNLFNYDNFATIGGISNDSVLVKSSTNLAGFNPIDFNDTKVSDKTVEKINLLDRLNLFNFFTKINNSLVNKFTEQIQPYVKEINDEPETNLIITEVLGCMNPDANNYNPNATVSGSCNFDFEITWQVSNEETQNLNYSVFFVADGVPVNTGNIGTYYSESEIVAGDDIESIYDNEFLNRTIQYNADPQLFFRFQVGGNLTSDLVELVNPNGLTLTPLTVLNPPNQTEINGYYKLTLDNYSGPNNFGNRLLEFKMSTTQTQDDSQEGGTYVPEPMFIIGQDLDLVNYGNPDIDNQEYGQTEVSYGNEYTVYPLEPQPVEVYGAPFTGQGNYGASIPNSSAQSMYGLVGPTNFILMDNTVVYTEPGHPFEDSEIELKTRIIEARPNEPFVLDNITYTQSFVRWEIKQGAEYIDRIFNDELEYIIPVDNFINVATYGESVKTITIEYDYLNRDPNTPIIIEGYFEQLDENGNDGNGKQPGG